MCLILNADHMIDLMKMVCSSLVTIRTMLAGETQTEDTLVQMQQLELLENLLIDRASQIDAIDRVLEEFNYSVAHELFAPLRRISGFTREISVRCAGEMEPEGVACLDNILESTQRLNDLIDSLMQLSRLSHLELQPVTLDLSEIAGHIAQELILAGPGRSVEFSIAPRLRVTADAVMLNIALRKLLENAWKYTAPKEQALIEFNAFDTGSEERFYVRDNGVGFDMADKGRLFHPFQRLHDAEIFPGNGIGLTAVKRIIERHGGRVWAEGAPDQGATFFFTLDLVHHLLP